MPAVREQFKTYHDFASADLREIYGDRLDGAYQLKTNELHSGIWINQSAEGAPFNFLWQELPWEAQLSPVNAIASGDFNRDGHMELLLAQNHFTNWLETGLWRGNPGCHLEWREGAFVSIPHRESGVLLPGDTKAVVPPKVG